MSYEITDKNFVSGTEEFLNFDNVKVALDDHINHRSYGVQTVWNIITFQIWYKKFMKSLN